MNLLFAFDQKCSSLFDTCIRSIVRNGGEDRYQVWILHSDLEKKDRENIQVAAGERVQCHFIYMDGKLFEGFPESRRYPRQIYYRILAPLFLPGNMERILYLDVDTVVINPLMEFYQMDFEKNCYIGCSHVRDWLTKFNQARLCAQQEAVYVNTGVMLFNLPALRRDLSIEKVRNFAEEKKGMLLLPDQDIICALYGDRIRLADTMVYNLSDRMLALYNADPSHEKRNLEWVRKNTSIIHYCGRSKPWRKNYVGRLGIFYREFSDRVSP